MSPAADVKTLVIDGHEVSARAGQTILEVAREHNIDIPTLCHLDGLSDVGACRLCVVEIKGVNKLLPACVTTVFEGMEVTTVTAKPFLSFCLPSATTSVRFAFPTDTANCRRWASSKASRMLGCPIATPSCR